MAHVAKKLIVKDERNSCRLDVFVSEELAITRSQAQKLIETECVTVNDKLPKKAGDMVRGSDVVIIAQPSNKSSNLSILQSSSAPKTKRLEDYKIIEPVIIAGTPDYLVVNKPSGLLVHPTQAKEKNTLVAWLIKKYPKIKKVGDDPTVRPGIVHRLDKEASGLMVIAKTQQMFEHLKNQFKNRTVEKEYYALAHGKVAKDWDEINFPIARGENFDRMAARPLRSHTVILSEAKDPLILKERDSSVAVTLSQNDNDGDEGLSPAKDARTEFLVEKRFANCTLLRVILHTGRMHQIRVHMLAYNHPLVGDPLYFQKKRKKNLDEKCGRLFLHSTKLAFTDLGGEKHTYTSPLPPELERFVTLLK